MLKERLKSYGTDTTLLIETHKGIAMRPFQDTIFRHQEPGFAGRSVDIRGIPSYDERLHYDVSCCFNNTDLLLHENRVLSRSNRLPAALRSGRIPSSVSLMLSGYHTKRNASRIMMHVSDQAVYSNLYFRAYLWYKGLRNAGFNNKSTTVITNKSRNPFLIFR